MVSFIVSVSVNWWQVSLNLVTKSKWKHDDEHPKTQKQNLKWWVVQCFNIKQHAIDLRWNKFLLFMFGFTVFSWITASWRHSSTAWEKHFLPGAVAPVRCVRRHLIFSRKISNHIIKHLFLLDKFWYRVMAINKDIIDCCFGRAPVFLGTVEELLILAHWAPPAGF